MPDSRIIDPNTKRHLLQDDELKKLFESKNVDLSKPIVLSCGSGVTATILYLALEKIGTEKSILPVNYKFLINFLHFFKRLALFFCKAVQIIFQYPI